MKKPKNSDKSRLPVIISGSVNLESILPMKERHVFETRFGNVDGYLSDQCWVIQRHGASNMTAPHRINHRANMTAAKQLGPLAFAIASVGSLDPEAVPGAIAIPDDIFSPLQVDTICVDDERIHVVPEFHPGLRRLVLEELNFMGIEIIDGGVYAQTRGPRFETKSEINWLSEYAHYVGMTCASELTIACELQLPYALMVSVDNWGNGLGPRPLTIEEFMLGVQSNHDQVCDVVAALLPSLVRAAATDFGKDS